MIAFALSGLVRGPRIAFLLAMLLAALFAVMEVPRSAPAALIASTLSA